jgi:hypothetical protein
MKNRIIRAIAGTFILISLLLSVYVSQNWLWFTAFVGAICFSLHNQMVLMEDILTKLGVKD